ncbi:MAG: hypothetical protein AAF591_22410 [Verrucomicrobiota bacterium]
MKTLFITYEIDHEKTNISELDSLIDELGDVLSQASNNSRFRILRTKLSASEVAERINELLDEWDECLVGEVGPGDLEMTRWASADIERLEKAGHRFATKRIFR